MDAAKVAELKEQIKSGVFLENIDPRKIAEGVFKDIQELAG